MQHNLTLTALTAQATDTTEKWREIPDSDGRYEVSDYGRVRSWYYRKGWQSTPLYRKTFTSKIGYVYYRLWIGDKPKNYPAHGLVLLAFVGDSELDVNHKDGNKQNNCLSNLEYVTAQQNTRHAMEVLGVRMGRVPGLAVETERDREIRAMVASGISQHETARHFGISQPYVGYIVRGLVRPPAAR